MKLSDISARIALLLAWIVCGSVKAQAPTPLMPYQEHEKRIRAAEMVEGLKSDLFGENVSLYTGSTEFSVTDIDVPGDNGLPVQLRRRFAVESHKEVERLGGFGSWDIDVPYLYGVFDSAYKWNIGYGSATARCSQTFSPAVSSPFRLHEIWSGNFMHLPSEGDQEILFLESGGNHQVPTDGATYRWGTRGLHRFSCLPSTSNGYPGEGFIAVDQAGTKYTFDVGIERHAGVMQTGTGSGTGRTKVFLMASRVEDRHGNWVAYNYTAGKLISITSSDGRAITLNYAGNNIISAIAHGRQWHYQYAVGNGIAFNRLNKLMTVVRPDGSTWKYQYSWEDAGRGGLNPDYIAWDGDPSLCTAPEFEPSSFKLTATHPSNAQGVFNFQYKRTTRTGVPSTACVNQNGRYVLAVGRYVDSYGLTSKVISGPGIEEQAWAYDYSSAGYDSGVPDSSTVTVIEPDGVRQRYTFGKKVGFNDGRLLKTVVQDVGGNALQTKVDTYVSEEEATAMPFPRSYGSLSGSDDVLTTRIRPVRSTVIAQDGVNYSNVVDAFDAFARSASTTQSSTLGYNRSQAMIYHDNLTKWVLGQVKQVTQTSPAPSVVMSQTDYNAADLPWKQYHFGWLQHTLTYNADGTLASVTDGKNNTTSLLNWKRGIPQTIRYADGTTQSAAVDDHGWIRSISDKNSFITNYDYDTMGRITLVDYPDGDTVDWASTVSSFTQANDARYGLPAGHWKQTINTGNARQVTYFDAFWRPIVEEKYDAGNVADTLSQAVKRYDAGGRLAFQSYPLRGLTDFNAAIQGTHTAYDALDRTTRVEQDSELGPLVTLTEYLPGFQTRITSPKGAQTTTSFMAYDQPTTEWPVSIAQAEGVHTDIVRDPFGKPLQLRRRNADSTVALTRQYVYGALHRLCKTIEPETGATVLGYDEAGNLDWSTAGMSLTDPNNCNQSEAYASGRRVQRSYDAMNRLIGLAFPDGNGNQSWAYWPDGLVRQIVTANDGILATNTYDYNKRRLLTGESLTQDGGSTWSIGYRYDALGHLDSHTYPSGRSVAYAPNALGQPTQASPYATGVRYYPNGAMAQFTYGNGQVHTLTQNARGLPERSHDRSGSITALDDSYDYDAHGNVAAISDARPGNRGHRDMAYDSLDRLTATTSPMFGAAEYAYDVLDNLRRVKAASRDHTYVYDASNRLTNVMAGASTVVGLGYDAQGNLNNKSGQTFAFDYGNRLRTAGEESYRYDGYGRRIQADHPIRGTIASMYGQDGVLRTQHNTREAKALDYIQLNGSLVAEIAREIAPAPPVITAPGYSTDGNFTVQWSVVPGATGYAVEESVDGEPWVEVYRGSAQSQAMEGRNNGAFSYRAQACNAAGCGSWSALATVFVQRPPYAPAGITVPASGPSGNYTVSWLPPNPRDVGPTTYTLQERFNDQTWTDAYEGADLSATFAGKAAGSYAYQIKACNPYGCSTQVAAANPVQVTYPPATPTALSVPESSFTGDYPVSWSASDGATTYHLDESFNDGAWTRVHDVTTTSVTLSGRQTGTYGYRVSACSSVGCSDVSATARVQVILPPIGVPSLTAPETTFNSTYDVDWTNVAVASNYQLVERLNSGGFVQVYEGPELSAVRSGRAPGNWDYMARACNVGGCGPWSAIKSTQVIGAPAMPNLSGPSTAGVGAAYNISWTSFINASSYQLEESANGGAWTFVADGNIASFTKSTGGSYAYRVRACNPAGCGEYSTVHVVSIAQGPPVPTGLRITLSTSMQCRLAWNSSSGATSYQLKDGTGFVHPMGTSTSFDWDARCTKPYNVRACDASACSAWSANAN
jgi:YD repeat-containing protein